MTNQLPEAESQTETKPAPPPEPRAAIFIGPIIVQSALTPIVGLVMLIAGLAVGYFARPLVTARLAAAAPTLTATVAGAVGPVAPTVAASPTSASASPQTREELVALLVAQTYHFKGSPDAPVTLLEFSDFQ